MILLIPYTFLGLKKNVYFCEYGAFKYRNCILSNNPKKTNQTLVKFKMKVSKREVEESIRHKWVNLRTNKSTDRPEHTRGRFQALTRLEISGNICTLEETPGRHAIFITKTRHTNFITKTRLFKYIENSTTKTWKFSDKNSDIFHISAQNIDCGYYVSEQK